MTELSAFYYDGHSSQRIACQIQIDAVGTITLPNGQRWPWQQLHVSPRIGNSARFIDLPDGGRLESQDNDTIDLLCQRFASSDNNSQGWIHRLESKLRYVALAVVITVASVWWFMAAGLPVLAREVAYQLPASITAELGAETLTLLEHSRVFSDSQLPAEEQAQLQQMFAQIAAQQPSEFHHQLHIRNAASTMGANALALPSGDILITDQLVALAEHPDALRGVFAHEIGHVEKRHGLRMILQSSAYPLVITAITGDMSIAASVLAALPGWLLEAQYSRGFEIEADQFAQRYMQSQGLSTQHLANLLRQLESKGGHETHGWFSTHPTTDSRIKALETQ